MRKGRDGGKKKRGEKKREKKEKKREKTDENSGHYVIASSRPPERRPLERRTLAPILQLHLGPLILLMYFEQSYTTTAACTSCKSSSSCSPATATGCGGCCSWMQNADPFPIINGLLSGYRVDTYMEIMNRHPIVFRSPFQSTGKPSGLFLDRLPNNGNQLG